MKICSKCQTKNQDSSHFCKKCGMKLSDLSFRDKKEKVLGEKKHSYWVPTSLVVAALILGGIGYWLIREKAEADPRVSAQPRTAERVDYGGQTISMTDIQATVKNGKISIPVDVLKEKKMVRFEYENRGAKIPLLSYITQSGRVVTAVSMCEPCRSTRFHIQDKTLICNACNTEWNLENLKGIRGGCLNYPPDVIQSQIEKNQIVIDEKTVMQWKPRV